MLLYFLTYFISKIINHDDDDDDNIRKWEREGRMFLNIEIVSDGKQLND